GGTRRSIFSCTGRRSSYRLYKYKLGKLFKPFAINNSSASPTNRPIGVGIIDPFNGKTTRETRNGIRQFSIGSHHDLSKIYRNCIKKLVHLFSQMNELRKIKDILVKINYTPDFDKQLFQLHPIPSRPFVLAE